MSEPDPVLARRARMARLAAGGQRAGYLLLLIAVAAFAVGAVAGFSPATTVVVAGALGLTTVVLAPAIVLGYAVKAADREDRERAAGWHGAGTGGTMPVRRAESEDAE